MSKLSETLLEDIASLSEGSVLAPKDFLYLGGRPAIHQALSHLTKSGQLIRITRGLYVSPILGASGKRAPSTEKVINSLAAKTQEVITFSCARSAKIFGLTLQVPVKEIYLTSGNPRTLILGNLKVQILRAPRWQLLLGSSTAGEAIRALAWMGEHQANETVSKLRKLLQASDWMLLASVSSQLPSWMAKATATSDNSAKDRHS